MAQDMSIFDKVVNRIVPKKEDKTVNNSDKVLELYPKPKGKKNTRNPPASKKPEYKPVELSESGYMALSPVLINDIVKAETEALKQKLIANVVQIKKVLREDTEDLRRSYKQPFPHSEELDRLTGASEDSFFERDSQNSLYDAYGGRPILRDLRDPKIEKEDEEKYKRINQLVMESRQWEESQMHKRVQANLAIGKLRMICHASRRWLFIIGQIDPRSRDMNYFDPAQILNLKEPYRSICVRIMQGENVTYTLPDTGINDEELTTRDLRLIYWACLCSEVSLNSISNMSDQSIRDQSALRTNETIREEIISDVLESPPEIIKAILNRPLKPGEL